MSSLSSSETQDDSITFHVGYPLLMTSSFWSSDPRQSLAEGLWKRKKNVWNRDYSALARCQIVCHFYSMRLVIISRREVVAHDITHFLFACLCLECSTVSHQRTVRTFWSEQMFTFISQLAQWGRTVLQLGLQLSRYLCHCSGTPWPWRHFFFSFIVLLLLFFCPRNVTTHACVWPTVIHFLPAADALDLTQPWPVKSP